MKQPVADEIIFCKKPKKKTLRYLPAILRVGPFGFILSGNYSCLLFCRNAFSFILQFEFSIYLFYLSLDFSDVHFTLQLSLHIFAQLCIFQMAASKCLHCLDGSVCVRR